MTKRADPFKYSLESVDRMVSVLMTLEQSEQSTLDKVARLSGLSEATALRYLSSLGKYGLVERDTRTGAYRLGLTLFRLGTVAIGRRDIGIIAEQVMERIRDSFQESVNLAARQLDQLMLIRVVEGSSPLRKGARVGEKEAWHATALGKAILAALPAAEAEEIIANLDYTPFTPHSLLNRDELERDLQAVRARSYAVDDEEAAEGLRCVGVAILDHNGEPQYALSVAGAKSRMPFTRTQEIGEFLLGASEEISRGLGLAL